MPKQKSTKSHSKYIALALATFSLIINFWAWSLLSPLGNVFAVELFLSPIQLAFLLAVPVLLGSVGRILCGVITDKIGGRAAFALVCLVTSIPVIGLMFADTYLRLLLAAVLLGAGGATFVVGIPYVSAWFSPEQRGLVLGIYSMGNAGTALSGFATPRLVEMIGRDGVFAVVGAILIALSLVFFVFGSNAPSWRPSVGSAVIRLKKSVRFRMTIDLSVVYVITFGAFVAFGVYLPVLLKVAYHLPTTDAATRAAGFVLLATIARPVGGWLSDKAGSKLVIKLSLLAVTVLAGFAAFQQTLSIHTTIVYLSLAFTLGCANGAVFAMVGKLTKPEIMGSVTGIIGAVGGMGGFVPPIIMGITHQWIQSFTPALVMLSVSAAFVLIFINSRFRDQVVYYNA